VTSDWHLSKYSNDQIDISSNLPERLSSLKNTMYFIASYVIENNIKNIVIAGDIFHNKSIIHSIALNIFLRFLRDHQELKFIIISGNHDLSGKIGNVVSALSSIEYEPNVTYISNPLKIGNILFVPYSSNMIETIKNSSSEYLISHFGLNEGMLNSGISVVADIGIKDLEGKYKNVLLGHYHKPQEIIRDNIKVYYTGRIETLQKARELKNQGHHVQLSQTEEMDVSDIRDEFKIKNNIVHDVTNRGICSSMTIEDKFKKYLEIREIPEDDFNEYLGIGFEIVNLCVEEI